MRCYNCNKEGHKSTDCHAKKKQEYKANVCRSAHEKLLVLNGSIEDEEVDKIVIDLGATTSIMSDRLANKLNIDIIPSNSKVKLADDRVMQVTGVTKNLRLSIMNHECKMSFVVFPHQEYDFC